MSGKEILVDTNIILYLLKGSDTLEAYLDGKDIYISFITELELIAPKNIPEEEEAKIAALLADCSIIPLDDSIKEKYKILRKDYHLKLADAIIASTALAMDYPLITADKQFKTIEGLNLITYQHDPLSASNEKTSRFS